MANYELELHIALIFLSKEEIQQLKAKIKPRQVRFRESGLLESNTNMFKVQEPTSLIKVVVPELPVTVTNIPFKASTKQEEVDKIQRMLLTNFSDDDEEEISDKSKDDEKLLLEDLDVSPLKEKEKFAKPQWRIMTATSYLLA